MIERWKALATHLGLARRWQDDPHDSARRLATHLVFSSLASGGEGKSDNDSGLATHLGLFRSC